MNRGHASDRNNGLADNSKRGSLQRSDWRGRFLKLRPAKTEDCPLSGDSSWLGARLSGGKNQETGCSIADNSFRATRQLTGIFRARSGAKIVTPATCPAGVQMEF